MPSILFIRTIFSLTRLTVFLMGENTSRKDFISLNFGSLISNYAKYKLNISFVFTRRNATLFLIITNTEIELDGREYCSRRL